MKYLGMGTVCDESKPGYGITSFGLRKLRADLYRNSPAGISVIPDGAFAAGGFSMEWEKMDAQVRGCQSLTEARAWMARAFGAAHAAADGHTEAEWASPLPAGPIMGGLPRHSVVSALMDHTAHHRGALTVYARLLGKVSPMPYMDA